MAYEKKPNYPSFTKPGIYPSGSLKELGLDNDDLEKFSLGNWNSIVRDNKLLVANASLIDIDDRGRPVQLQFDDDTFTSYNTDVDLRDRLHQKSPLIMFLVRKDDEGRIKDIAWEKNNYFHPDNIRDEDGEFSRDDEFDYFVPRIYYPWNNGGSGRLLRVGDPDLINTDNIYTLYTDDTFFNIDNQTFPGQRRNSSGIKGLIPLTSGNIHRDEKKRAQQIEILSYYCLTNQDQELIDLLEEYGQGTGGMMEQDIEDWMVDNTDEGFQFAFKFYGLKSDKKISFEDGFGYIQPKSDDYVNEPLKGAIDILLDDVLLEKYRNLVFERELTDSQTGWTEDRNDGVGATDYWTHQIFFPRVIGLKNEFTSFEYSTDSPVVELGGNKTNGEPDYLGNTERPRNDVPIKIPYVGTFNISAFGLPISWNENNTALGYDADYDEGDDEFRPNPLPFTTFGANIIRVFYDDNSRLNSNFEEWAKLGAPLFKPNEDLLLGSLNNFEGYDEVDFIVDCVNTDTNDIPLYYDVKDDLHTSTSYPLKISLKILLEQNVDFENPLNLGEFNFTPSDLIYTSSGSFEDTSFYANQIANLDVEDHHYRYKVIQWGDEDFKLTDEQIQNTYFFNIYDEDAYPDRENYSFKKLGVDQFFDFKPIGEQGEISTHVYNTPGVKNIKIIISRLTRDGSFVLQTYLVTKNIVVNDGALLSQDFSIFGGTDFNFLPLSNKEAIIGGLNGDSKYNNSVKKIKKDDNFIEEDYLERVSSRDFIDNFNKKLYGESPGQLDLSTTRIFKKPFDIYDFITDDKQSIVNNNFNIDTLPINSSATDIFISDEDCTVELNMDDLDYLSIQNTRGNGDKAILIGDYKIDQPKDGAVQRQGVMETPLLDDREETQAF